MSVVDNSNVAGRLAEISPRRRAPVELDELELAGDVAAAIAQTSIPAATTASHKTTLITIKMISTDNVQQADDREVLYGGSLSCSFPQQHMFEQCVKLG